MIRIIIHTLAAHAHVCDRYSKPVAGFAARSRDMSQLSLEEEDGNQDAHTAGSQQQQDQGGPGDEGGATIMMKDIGNKIIFC